MTHHIASPRGGSRRFGLRSSMIGAVCLILGGCSSAPDVKQTGFLSSYSNLKADGESRMRYASPELQSYTSFIIDPVQVSLPEGERKGELTPAQRAEVANHFHKSLSEELTKRGYNVTDTPGANTARFRIAITNIHESTWWKKVHPASKLAGAGRGGAAMEGEVIDSVSGEQLAGVVQTGVASQFSIQNFGTVSDINDVVDTWVKNACDRMDDLRDGKQPG